MLIFGSGCTYAMSPAKYKSFVALYQRQPFHKAMAVCFGSGSASRSPNSFQVYGSATVQQAKQAVLDKCAKGAGLENPVTCSDCTLTYVDNDEVFDALKYDAQNQDCADVRLRACQ